MTIDFAIMELLASKICHDLISPIGAVNNGVEFLEEMGADAGEEVTGLIAYSAAQASAKLQAYRMAYGSGGGDSSIKPEDVHKIIEAIVSADKKIVQNWDPYAPLGPDERPDGFSKILISAMLLAMDSLPRGGELCVMACPDDPAHVLITATGENAGLRAGSHDALTLSMSAQELEPKYIHAYITGLNAQNYGAVLSVANKDQGCLVIKITLDS